MTDEEATVLLWLAGGALGLIIIVAILILLNDWFSYRGGSEPNDHTQL